MKSILSNFGILKGMRKNNSKTDFVLKRINGRKVAFFIDNANWFYPQKELGWRISFTKLRAFLEEICQIKITNLYAGTPLDQADRQKFDRFCQAVKKSGFKVVTKPLKKIMVDRKNQKFEYKCNFDVEIALDVARVIDKIDLIIIGSGDSDFLEIKKFALEHKKAFLVICFEKGVAWEMRQGHHLFLEDIRKEVEQK